MLLDFWLQQCMVVPCRITALLAAVSDSQDTPGKEQMSSLAATIKWHAVKRVAACLGQFTLECGTYEIVYSSHTLGHWHDAHLQQSFPLITFPDPFWATKTILKLDSRLNRDNVGL